LVGARIGLGYQFRDAMEDVRAIGHQVADDVVEEWFSCSG
jgi:hypothetical protein